MPEKVLITGGAGFAGSHIVEHSLHNTDWDIIVLDRISYAGSLERLRSAREEFPDRLSFIFHDFRAAYPPSVMRRLDGVRFLIHNGGETHVDRSLDDPEPFVASNVLGTLHTLEAAKQLCLDRFIYVSTDEVHGPAPDGIDFDEDAPMRPSNPYSASKCGGEALSYAWWKSYGVPTIISRTMNMIGEMQHGEKFVPTCIRKISRNEIVTIHGNSKTIGSRKWIHARNQASGLLFLLVRGVNGESYHIAGEERNNLEIAQFVAQVLGKPNLGYQLVDFHAARKGHDRRYSLSDKKIRQLGWKPPLDLETSLRKTIEWSVRPENEHWLEPR